MNADEHKLKSIQELMDSIADLENLKQYYENRLLRKRIALVELTTMLESHSTPLPPLSTPALISGSRRRRSPSLNSLRSRILSVVPELPVPFDYGTVWNALAQKYPDEMKNRKKSSLYSTWNDMLTEYHEIKQVPGGYALNGEGGTPPSSSSVHHCSEHFVAGDFSNGNRVPIDSKSEPPSTA